MKILIVASKFWPAVGGLETAVRNIAVQLKRMGHQVVIVTNKYSRKLKNSETVEEIPVKRFYFTGKFPRGLNLWIWFKYGVRCFLAPVSLYRLVMVIKKERPSIIHLHFVGSSALYLLIVRHFVPFKWVVSLHGADVELYDKKSIYEKWLLRETIKEADYITANGKALMEEAFEKTGVCKANTQIVPMAFFCEDYSKVQPYAGKRPYIFSAGRFVHKKGFDVLIRAFLKLVRENQYQGDLIIAGEGEEFSNYRKLVKDLQGENRVHFFGVADSKQMAQLTKGCELFVMPSRLEAFGILALEALCADKRVVASRVGGLVAIMEENPDYLVEANDENALAEKMLKGLQDIDWKRIDKETLKKRYSWEKTTDMYLDIYTRLLGA